MTIYNELEPFAAAWLRNLSAAGHIAPGDVDERSIRDLKGADLDGRTQVHLFAGIGGWSYALRLAGWPDDRAVWTGSCPCQPFSSAGKKRGDEDERHLWPEMVRLVAECRPPTIFGEQVASDDGRAWLAGVRADLEALGYAVGAADLCAASVGAPHIRQRLFWVAVARHGEPGRRSSPAEAVGGRPPSEASGRGDIGRLGDADERGLEPRRQGATPPGHRRAALADGDTCGLGHADVARREGNEASAPPEGRDAGRAGAACRLADAASDRGAEQQPRSRRGSRREPGSPDGSERPRSRRMADAGRPGDERGLRPDEARSASSPDGGATQQRERRGLNPWGGSRLIECADGKARRVGPGVFPLAHGVPARVGRLRAYGNAIVSSLAAEFVSVTMEAIQ